MGSHLKMRTETPWFASAKHWQSEENQSSRYPEPRIDIAGQRMGMGLHNPGFVENSV
jgi:hypothetical protein